VPVLWDEKRNEMVNNESADILRMFNSAFAELAPNAVDLYPDHLAEQIDEIAPWLYDKLNNGVYKSGFASSQGAYNEAVQIVFDALDTLEDRMTDGRPFLHGTEITESDIRLFVTLIRFDAAYHGLFKTNLKRISDYPQLVAYLARMLKVRGIRDTVDLTHIKAGYYSIKTLNPGGIVPLGPQYIDQMMAGSTPIPTKYHAKS
jgi:putative glutathione S-transferase